MQQSSGGTAGAGGSSSMGIQGTPEQNPIGAPIDPGLGTPSDNGIGGAPPNSEDDDTPPANTEPPALENVLVFSRTVGYRHDAIGVGIEAIRQLGSANGFGVVATEDAAQFTDATLAGFDVVVFLSTTSDVLDDTQQAAFQRYIQAGGGWVGVHAATDTEYDWPWYGQLIGGNAWFKSHPEIQTVTLDVEKADHASTAHLPATFQLQDEWYNFQANPRPSVTVLLRLDESSYSPGVDAMGDDHPIAWYHEFDGGRAWYTALGHRQELYQDPLFTQHLLGGIRWAAGVAP
ncbi:MAG TPA: ThuA domain-containing protein [Polyangiaceae bacterium]|nr:ThuA domain-containing protein [Polyangiaceae bacterium]